VNIDDIRNLFAYNDWANRRLLVAAGSLTNGEFTRDMRTSHTSIQGTFVHILWGEWLWVRRWRGESPKVVFTTAEYRNVAELVDRWSDVQREQGEFVDQLSEGLLNSRVTYENLHGQRWEYSLAHMMQHVVNHSSYHRGQITALLRQLTYVPPATDLLVFFDESE
jgi:uncharacterized damage-inducible protein DinB